jgi:hypothetical protein
MYPCWRVCGKNLNIVSMCAVSPVVCKHRTSLAVKKLFSVFLWLWTVTLTFKNRTTPAGILLSLAVRASLVLINLQGCPFGSNYLQVYSKISGTVHIYTPTRCNNFSVYYPDVYLQLIMFRSFSRPSSGAQWLQWQPLVLPSYCGDSRAVFVVGPARPRTQHDCLHDTKVKPEAATAVIELLTKGGKTPETWWALNKHQDNKLKNFCIRLVIYLN